MCDCSAVEQPKAPSLMVPCRTQGRGLMLQAQHGLTVLKDHPDRVRLIRSTARSSAQGMVRSACCTFPQTPACLRMGGSKLWGAVG